MIIHDVEQRSPEWHKLRCGIPTASEFSQIITTKGVPSKSASGYAISLAAELYIGRPVNMWDGNSWTDRGKEMEQHAVSLYEFATDADVKKIGFVTSDDGNAGCSPDGFVGDDGLVEIKCLKAENHIRAILHHKQHGECPPDYIQQTQGQLFLCERKWCDLVFYHPDLPLLTVRQYEQQQIAEALGTGILALIAERDKVLETLQSIATQ